MSSIILSFFIIYYTFCKRDLQHPTLPQSYRLFFISSFVIYVSNRISLQKFGTKLSLNTQQVQIHNQRQAFSRVRGGSPFQWVWSKNVSVANNMSNIEVCQSPLTKNVRNSHQSISCSYLAIQLTAPNPYLQSDDHQKSTLQRQNHQKTNKTPCCQESDYLRWQTDARNGTGSQQKTLWFYIMFQFHSVISSTI